MIARFWFWLTHNASSAHCRVLQRYLERRGWVVFYLEPEHRVCPGGGPCCWLQLYQSGVTREAGR